MGYIEMIIGVATFAATILIIPAIPAEAANGWRQSSAQEWVYMGYDKKLANQWVLWPDGTMCYVGDNSRTAADRWANVGEAWYCVRSDGFGYENEWSSLVSKLSLPSVSLATSWHYAGSDGIILRNRWYELGGKDYYFYEQDSSPRKAFFNLGDKRYYVDEERARKAPGWFSIDKVDSRRNPYSNWYCVTGDGSLLRDGWHEVESMAHYLGTYSIVYRN